MGRQCCKGRLRYFFSKIILYLVKQQFNSCCSEYRQLRLTIQEYFDFLIIGHDVKPDSWVIIPEITVSTN